MPKVDIDTAYIENLAELLARVQALLRRGVPAPRTTVRTPYRRNMRARPALAIIWPDGLTVDAGAKIGALYDFGPDSNSWPQKRPSRQHKP